MYIESTASAKRTVYIKDQRPDKQPVLSKVLCIMGRKIFQFERNATSDWLNLKVRFSQSKVAFLSNLDDLVNQKLCYFQIWKILGNNTENVLKGGLSDLGKKFFQNKKKSSF